MKVRIPLVCLARPCAGTCLTAVGSAIRNSIFLVVKREAKEKEKNTTTYFGGETVQCVTCVKLGLQSYLASYSSQRHAEVLVAKSVQHPGLTYWEGEDRLQKAETNNGLY